MKTKLPEHIAKGYSSDKRKRRREHRRAASNLIGGGGFFNNGSAPGSTFHFVARWHLAQARWVGR